jgi:hypothetical protein
MASDSQQARSNCKSTISVDRNDDFGSDRKSANRTRAFDRMARGCDRVEGPEGDDIPQDIYACEIYGGISEQLYLWKAPFGEIAQRSRRRGYQKKTREIRARPGDRRMGKNLDLRAR